MELFIVDFKPVRAHSWSGYLISPSQTPRTQLSILLERREQLDCVVGNWQILVTSSLKNTNMSLSDFEASPLFIIFSIVFLTFLVLGHQLILTSGHLHQVFPLCGNLFPALHMAGFFSFFRSQLKIALLKYPSFEYLPRIDQMVHSAYLPPHLNNSTLSFIYLFPLLQSSKPGILQLIYLILQRKILCLILC